MRIKSKTPEVPTQPRSTEARAFTTPPAENTERSGWKAGKVKPSATTPLAQSSMAAAMTSLDYQAAIDPEYLKSRTTPENIAATRNILVMESSDTRGVFLAGQLFQGARPSPHEFTIALVGAGHVPALTEAAAALGLAHFVAGALARGDEASESPPDLYSYGLIRLEQHPLPPATRDAQAPAVLFVGELHFAQAKFALPPVATLLKAGVKKVRVGVENETGNMTLCQLAMSAPNKAAIAAAIEVYQKAGITVEVVGLDPPVTPQIPLGDGAPVPTSALYRRILEEARLGETPESTGGGSVVNLSERLRQYQSMGPAFASEAARLAKALVEVRTEFGS